MVRWIGAPQQRIRPAHPRDEHHFAKPSYSVLTSWMSFVIDAFASPKSMTVFGL